MGRAARVVAWASATVPGRITATLLFLVSLGSVTLSPRIWGLRDYVDFEVYWNAAQVVVAGGNVYAGDFLVGNPDHEILLPFTYPPVAGLFFSPLAAVAFSRQFASLMWLLLTLVILWWCIRRLISILWPTCAHMGWVAWAILPFAMRLEPVSTTLYYGQVNIVLMALVLADVSIRHRRYPRGVLVGVAAAIKITPIVFVAYYLVQRKWAQAAWAVLSAAGLTGLAWLLFPGPSRQFWFHEVENTGRVGRIWGPTNMSINGFLARLTGSEQGAAWLKPAWAVAVVVGALFVGWALLRLVRCFPQAGVTGGQLVVLSVVSLFALWNSPISWSHHWVWLLVFLAVVLKSWVVHRYEAGWGLGILFISGVVLATVLPLHQLVFALDPHTESWNLVEDILGTQYVFWSAVCVAYVGWRPHLFTGVMQDTKMGA